MLGAEGVSSQSSRMVEWNVPEFIVNDFNVPRCREYPQML